MTLNDIFEQLSYGELSQLSIGGAVMGKIDESNYGKVLAHINLGLSALYKRFNLKEGKLVIQLNSGLTVYPLNKNFSQSNRRSREAIKFIVDSAANPFIGGINKIKAVFTEYGYELGLNDRADSYSLFTPTLTVLEVPSELVNPTSETPEELLTTTLGVVYRAAHPPIEQTLGYFDAGRVEVELPDTHLEALLLFVAARAYTPMGMTNEFNPGNNFAKRYELACQALELQNYQVDQDSQTNRLQENGWV